MPAFPYVATVPRPSPVRPIVTMDNMDSAEEPAEDLSAYQTRLTALEDAISKLELQQDRFRPLLKLASGSFNFQKMTAALKTVAKKCDEIEGSLNGNQQSIEESKEAVASLGGKFKGAMEEEKEQRLKDIQSLNTRIAGLNKFYEDVQQENQSVLKVIESTLKTEVASLVQNLEEKLRAQKTDLQQVIDSARSELQEELMAAKKEEGMLQLQLEKFEKDHEKILQSASEASAGRDKVDLRAWLFGEVRSRIGGAVEECRAHMDKRFKSLRVKYMQEVLSIRGQLEQLRDVIAEQQGEVLHRQEGFPPEKRLELLNTDLKRELLHLEEIAKKSLETILEGLAGVRSSISEASEEIVKLCSNSSLPKEELTSRLQTLFSGVQEQIDQSFIEVDALNTRNRADFFTVEETVQMAADVIKHLGIKETDPVERRNSAKRENDAYRKLHEKYGVLKREILEREGQITSTIRDLSTQVFGLARKIQTDTGVQLQISQQMRMITEASSQMEDEAAMKSR